MTGHGFPELITPDEAIKLFDYAGIQEIYIARNLYVCYREHKGRDDDRLMDMLSLLAFIYDSGRVQGIREERLKKGHGADAVAHRG